MDRNEIEEKIIDLFEQNYELLRMEGGHTITQYAKDEALKQVLYYYEKLHHIAEHVTETEVRLSLPEQKTPGGKKFMIEGVVDIVCEDDEVWMYDIKTHDPDYIRAHKELYERQLNVYRYIWETLRGNDLTNTAVISTSYPEGLKKAVRDNDRKKIKEELKKWDPVIEIPTSNETVEKTVKDFARVVDCIEKSCFKPASPEKLKDKVKGTGDSFAVRICRNCDARFSCRSYREYAGGQVRGGKGTRYFTDYVPEEEQEEFVMGNLGI